VQLIGGKTYGKPVGFFAIKIDKIELYLPQFETKNSLNEGGYYTGLPVDYTVVDDVSRDFGDRNERLLAAALSHSEKGSFTFSKPDNTISSLRKMSVNEQRELTTELDKEVFKGMNYDKLKLKKR